MLPEMSFHDQFSFYEHFLKERGLGMRIRIACRSAAQMAALLCCFIAAASGQSTHYDLLLKGGHVIDPANRIDAVMDVAIAGGKIAAVEKNISPDSAGKVVDVSGLYVTP